MKYYLIAGEASGDLHASNLMTALKEQDPEADFRFLGGDLMLAAGGVLVKHYREMAYMGFIPVLMHLPAILRNMKMCKEDIRDYRPDVVILIDYPGFNLKIAEYVKTALQIPVYYYISPKIWAWKKYRIKSIRRNVARMFCILPFEIDFYKKLNYSIDYVGNPTVDSVSDYLTRHAVDRNTFLETENLPDKPILALLAGSRKQEIKDNLPTMLEVAKEYPGYQILIAGAPGIDPEYYNLFTKEHPADIIFNKTYALLQHSRAALVTSGTATLETALFQVPQVVCYKTPLGGIVNFVFRHFFEAPYISLVNLIARRPVVKELFGALFTRDNIRQELDLLLNNTDYRDEMISNYREIIRTLGAPGASGRAAALIYGSLK